ncbi:MAG TPA: hypothetical protein IAC45_00305 [Candidatus Aphodousia faecavium]|uniref:Uncharacterized protein n=1 Tax=Parasutterella secunda TaxID=626947 RepID=A0ABS2GVK9_9BURK|nr:hypothetical protein [Parasutterella secunda]MBM6928952.1 hypothetical protein [Parasutterella secunda]HIT95509.1 hypothetical protein [Candidatus Aphodousia faecavium]
MMHHLFGPHVFGPPLLHGISNLVLLILLAAAVWYFVGRVRKPAQGPADGSTENLKAPQDKKSAQLESEIERLQRENELLRELLQKELKRNQ